MQEEQKNYSNTRRFNRRFRKTGYEAPRFYWCYGMGDIPEDMELLLADDLPLIHSATTISQAKGITRSDIRYMGGNAGLYLSEERQAVSKSSNSYEPAQYVVSAYAALIVPKNLSAEKREALLERFKKNIEFSKECQKSDTSEWEIFLLGLFVMALAIIVIAMFYSNKL